MPSETEQSKRETKQRNAAKTSEILTTTATAAERENVTITIQMEIAGEKSNSRQKKKSNQREITIPVMRTEGKFNEKFQNAKQSKFQSKFHKPYTYWSYSNKFFLQTS